MAMYQRNYAAAATAAASQQNPQQPLQMQPGMMARPTAAPPAAAMLPMGMYAQRPLITASNPMLAMGKRSKICRWNAPVTQDAINEFYSRYDSLRD